MDKLKSTFLQLSEREQRLVIISAVLVIVAIFYWGIWSPLNTSLEQGQTAVNNQTELLAWVQKNANRAAQLRSSGDNNTRFSGSLPQADGEYASADGTGTSLDCPQACRSST